MAEEHPRRSDELEFLPATSEQLEKMGTLADGTLDGTVTLAFRHHVVDGPLFEGRFYQEMIVRHNQGDGTIEPLSNEEAKALLEGPEGPPADLLEGARNNRVGLDISLAYTDEHPSGRVEIGVPVDGNTVTYDTGSDIRLEREGLYAFFRHLRGLPRQAAMPQAQALLRITELIASLKEAEVPSLLEDEVIGRLQQEFDIFTFEVNSGDTDVSDPETAATLKARLLDGLSERSIRAIFKRRFVRQNGEACMVLLGFKMDSEGNVSKYTEIQTRVPTSIDEFDVFVTSVKLYGDGSYEHSQYFDIDFEKKAKEADTENPDSDSFQQLGALVERFNDALWERTDQQRVFREEKSEGFHEFSQADAQRIIDTLENPGEEIVIGWG